MTTDFHLFGRNHLINAWEALFGVEPELHEVQLVQGVSLGEGGYGLAKYTNQLTGESAVLNNWGATQCPHGPPCGASCFEVTDQHGPEWKKAHPGQDPHYQWCYNRYPTPEEGAVAFINRLKKIVDRSTLGFQDALSTRSVDSFVRSMREGGYFELGLEQYQANVWKHVNTIASALNEPVAVQKEEGEPGSSGATPLSPSESPPLSDTEPSGLQKNCVEKDDDIYE